MSLLALALATQLAQLAPATPTLDEQYQDCEAHHHQVTFDREGRPHVVDYVKGFEQCYTIRAQWEAKQKAKLP